METKNCSKCGETKPLVDFCKSTQVKSGYTAHCKVCKRIYAKASNDRIRAKDPEAFVQRQREYTKTYKAKYPERVREKDRRQKLARFGITLEAYDSMLESQKGRCRICYDIPRNKRFAVDHDHKCCSGNRSCGKWQNIMNFRTGINPPVPA